MELFGGRFWGFIRRNSRKGLLVALAFLSLLVASSWSRSYWRRDLVQRTDFLKPSHEVRGLYITSSEGLVRIEHEYRLGMRAGEAFHPGVRWEFFTANVSKHAGWETTGGFGFGRSSTARDAYWTLYVPHWVLLLLVLGPTIWLVVSEPRRAKALRDGTVPCQRCGYDLRATPARCPECGLVVTAPSGATTETPPIHSRSR